MITNACMIWGKGNTFLPYIKVQTNTATKEINVEFPPKVRNILSYYPIELPPDNFLCYPIKPLPGSQMNGLTQFWAGELQ